MSIRLLICDDHPVVRSGLVRMFSGQEGFEVVGEAQDGEEGLRLARSRAPDVVLMDLRMPRMDGVDATQAIKTVLPETHVLVLTTYETDSDVLRALEMGAEGYLLKDAPERDLFSACRSVVSGGAPLSNGAAARLVAQVGPGASETLTPRQVRILSLLAQGKSDEEIAAERHDSTGTIKQELRAIFRKLGAKNRTGAVVTALKRGIIGFPD